MVSVHYFPQLGFLSGPFICPIHTAGLRLTHLPPCRQHHVMGLPWGSPSLGCSLSRGVLFPAPLWLCQFSGLLWFCLTESRAKGHADSEVNTRLGASGSVEPPAPHPIPDGTGPLLLTVFHLASVGGKGWKEDNGAEGDQEKKETKGGKGEKRGTEKKGKRKRRKRN